MKTIEKNKAKESGFQLIGAGAVGTVLAAVLDFANVVDTVDFDQHGWIGVAAVAIGAAYRGFCKYLDSKGIAVDEAKNEKVYDAGERVYEAVEEFIDSDPTGRQGDS